MFAYALLLALKRKYGYRVFLEGRHLEHLSYYFQNINDVESLDVLCDEESSFPWENVTQTWHYLGQDNVRHGHYIDYASQVSLKNRSFILISKIILCFAAQIIGQQCE